MRVKGIEAHVAPDLQYRLRHGLEPGDLGLVLALHGREFLAEFGFGSRFEAYVAQGLSEFALSFDPSGDRMWIAEDGGGSPIGTVTVARRPDGAAQLRWFVVSNQVRGQGIGKALLREAIAFARATGRDTLYLWTVAGLDAALHLYGAAGFRLVEETPNAHWSDRPLMEQRYVLDLSGLPGPVDVEERIGS